jgi:hypothetical protein
MALFDWHSRLDPRGKLRRRCRLLFRQWWTILVTRIREPRLRNARKLLVVWLVHREPVKLGTALRRSRK